MPCGKETHEHIDPVCKMKVEHTDDAIHSEYEGEVYLFCCQTCKDEFDKDPTKYLE